MADDDVAFKESLLNTLAGTLSVNHQERVFSEDQLKIFETVEGAVPKKIFLDNLGLPLVKPYYFCLVLKLCV